MSYENLLTQSLMHSSFQKMIDGLRFAKTRIQNRHDLASFTVA